MPTNHPPTTPESGRSHMPPGSMPTSPPPPARSTSTFRDREMLKRLHRMMEHILRRNPGDCTADTVAREIDEHLETYPLT